MESDLEGLIDYGSMGYGSGTPKISKVNRRNHLILKMPQLEENVAKKKNELNCDTVQHMVPYRDH
jgi:hypothetical protein